MSDRVLPFCKFQLLAGIFMLPLLLTMSFGCQSETEQAISEAQSLQEEGEFEAAYTVLSEAPLPDESTDEYVELGEQIQELRNALRPRVVIEKLENAHEYSQKQDDEKVEEILEEAKELAGPDIQQQDQAVDLLVDLYLHYQSLMDREDEFSFSQTMDHARAARSAREFSTEHGLSKFFQQIIEELIENENYEAAERRLNEYREHFPDEESEQDHLELQLQVAWFGETGTPEYYFGKGEHFAASDDLEELEKAVEYFDQLLDEYPDHEFAEEASEQRDSVDQEISDIRRERRLRGEETTFEDFYVEARTGIRPGERYRFDAYLNAGEGTLHQRASSRGTSWCRGHMLRVRTDFDDQENHQEYIRRQSGSSGVCVGPYEVVVSVSGGQTVLHQIDLD